MQPVSIITPTGGRPLAFELCKRYVERQTYEAIQWIVADDGDPSEIEDLTCRAGIEVARVFPEPKWRPGQNTLARNLLAAIPHVKSDKVLFFEDDDWYASDYVALMSVALDEHVLVGQYASYYYNIESLRWKQFQYLHRASLCATGFRTAELLPLLRTVCEQGQFYIDVEFWHSAFWRYPYKLLDGIHCVGIKGLPGRYGIGIGHRPTNDWSVDTDGSVLRSWVGKEDAEVYERIFAAA